jgi:hypothetical protein
MERSNLVGVPICVVNYRMVSVLPVQAAEDCDEDDGHWPLTHSTHRA